MFACDCLPVIVCHRKATKVAAIHAGWRGLASGVIESTINALGEPVDDLIVWLGPAISQPNFEVGPEVREAFLQALPFSGTAFIPTKDDRWLANMYQLARLRLQRLGISAIYGGDRCSYREKETFYSYRREETTGRMATAIWISQ